MAKAPQDLHDDAMAMIVPSVDEQQSTQPLQRLRKAQFSERLVRVRRRDLGVAVVEGFIVGIGEQWLMLAVVLDTNTFVGWSMVRLADITKVTGPRSRSTAARRHLQAGGHWPVPRPTRPVDLGTTEDLFKTVQDCSDVLEVRCERLHSAVIGRPEQVAVDAVTMVALDERGRARGPRSSLITSDVTRIDVPVVPVPGPRNSTEDVAE